MAKTAKKTFGSYEVAVNEKTLETKLYYVWPDNKKEEFKGKLSPSQALCCLRDIYMKRGTESYEAAKAFLWTYIEKEF